MSSNPISTSPQRYIILDTCIFSHLGNSELSQQIIFQLQDAASKGYGLAMSRYTMLELIDSSNVEDEVKAMNYTRGIKHFSVSKEILIAAGHLGGLYKDDGLEFKQQPEGGDKIIGATAILKNAVIFTTNGRDFPRPLFKEITTISLTYTKQDHYKVHISAYFLEPDILTISTKYNLRMNNHKKKYRKTRKKDNLPIDMS